MRVAWCTPFSARSGIGEFSAEVVSQLRRLPGIDVDILYPIGAGGRLEPDPGLELDASMEEKLVDYDAVYYNIGDHWGYHGDLVRALRRVPGIVVLHDASLTHLLMTELLRLNEGELTRVLSRLYGPPGVGVAETLRTEPGEWPARPENVENYPLLGLVLESALGVVTHSEFAAVKVRREYAGDVWNIPLPSLPLRGSESGETVSLTVDDRPFVLQAGAINRTKCVSTVVEAFRMAELSDRAQLVICGYADPQVLRSLRNHVARLGLSDSVRVMGAVSDEVLDSLRRRATLATVLRYPIGEAASKVLLDSMAYGLAVLTVDAGHYVEVPDDTVLRIESPPSTEKVADMLSYAISHPLDLYQMAQRARLYVQSHRSLSRYADEVIRVARDAGNVGRRRELATDLRDIVERIGFAANDPICDCVAETVAELFGRQARMAQEIYPAKSDRA